MDTGVPPSRSEYPAGAPGDTLWGQARAVWFKDRRRPRPVPEPQVIERETVRVEYVDRDVERVVERIVEVPVDRIVERIVTVEAAPVEHIEIPAFLRESDDLAGDAFLASQRKSWEVPAQTLERLNLEVEGLMNKSRYTVLTPEEDARYQELTTGLGQVIAG